MEHATLFTMAVLATAITEVPYTDHHSKDVPVGTILEDAQAECVVIVLNSRGEHSRISLVTGDDLGPGWWYNSRPVTSDRKAVPARQDNNDYQEKYLNYERNAGRIFQLKEDGELFLCTYGMGIHDDDGDTVTAIGITDKSRKLTGDQYVVRWMAQGEDGKLVPWQPNATSKEIRARSGR